MGSTAQRNVTEELDKFVRDFFEPQLVALGLGEKQVNEQSLEELNQSLDRINDLIKNPEQFGILRLNYDPVSGFYVGKNTGILTERGPLLERGIRQQAGQAKGTINLLVGNEFLEDLSVRNFLFKIGVSL